MTLRGVATQQPRPPHPHERRMGGHTLIIDITRLTTGWGGPLSYDSAHAPRSCHFSARPY